MDRQTDGLSTGVRAWATADSVMMMQTPREQSQRKEVSWEALLSVATSLVQPLDRCQLGVWPREA